MKYWLTQLLTGILVGTHLLPASAEGFSEALTQSALIQTVLAENPGIDAFEAAEQAAIARINPAGALDAPMLSTSVAPRQFGGSSEIDRSFNLELSQFLPWPDKRTERATAVRLNPALPASAAKDNRALTLETLQSLELYRDELPPLAKDALEATIAVNSGLNVLPHRARCMWFIYTEYKHATR